MKKELGLRLDPAVDTTPSYVSFDQDQVWVGAIENGRYRVPVAFFTDSTVPLDGLLKFWASALADFEKKYDGLVKHQADVVRETHNKFTTGRFRLHRSVEVIRHLVPDRAHFWERDLFCLEFTPYRPLAHLGLSLRFFITQDWHPQATSWDRDQPSFRPKRPNKSPQTTRAFGPRV